MGFTGVGVKTYIRVVTEWPVHVGDSLTNLLISWNIPGSRHLQRVFVMITFGH